MLQPMIVVRPTVEHEHSFTTGIISVENNKDSKCFVCGWKSATLHILTITCLDSMASTRIPLCKSCALEIAEELLTAVNEIN